MFNKILPKRYMSLHLKYCDHVARRPYWYYHNTVFHVAHLGTKEPDYIPLKYNNIILGANVSGHVTRYVGRKEGGSFRDRFCLIGWSKFENFRERFHNKLNLCLNVAKFIFRQLNLMYRIIDSCDFGGLIGIPHKRSKIRDFPKIKGTDAIVKKASAMLETNYMWVTKCSICSTYRSSLWTVVDD